MQFIDLKAQYEQVKIRIDKRISAVLAHGQYILGPEVSELEYQLAEYVGVKHVITCANGTDALQIALMTLGVGQGDAVIVPTFTFFASAEVIALTGATPIFIDSDPDTFNVSVEKLEATIEHVHTKSELNLKAIMAVDLFGQPADYPNINQIAKKHNLKVIEDAAQGFGGQIGTQKAGSFADIATTSFFPAKPLGCYGDGGAVFTNNDEYAELMRSIRVHGKGVDKYDNIRIGLNSRLDTIQAAVLLEKLAIFPQELKRRNEIALLYTKLFMDKPEIKAPVCKNGYTSSWAQYTLLAKNTRRTILQQRAKNQNIPTAVYYATCMHQQTVFKGLKSGDFDFSVAENIAKRCFSLPMHPYLTDADVKRVAESILSD